MTLQLDLHIVITFAVYSVYLVDRFSHQLSHSSYVQRIVNSVASVLQKKDIDSGFMFEMLKLKLDLVL